MLTRKQIIARVRKHFTQAGVVYGVEEDDEGNRLCVYRGDDNPSSPIRCAFGVLIPNYRYRPEMEALTVEELIVKFFPEKFENAVFERLTLPIGIMPDNASFNRMWIEHLQQLHDLYARAGAQMVDFLAALDRFEQATT